MISNARFGMKLRAFTLMELMVTMVVSSIVIGAIYSGFDIVRKQFSVYQDKNGKVAELLFFNSLINKDIINASSVMRTDIELIMINNNDRKITWVMDEQMIVRRDHLSEETFDLPVRNFECRLQSEEVTRENAYIDEILFDIYLKNDQQQFHFKKNYGTDFLLTAEQTEEEEEL
jgi:prepilin-type N-terminal cleavage/methylation domain-containing protein